jgi:hypothetical protein
MKNRLARWLAYRPTKIQTFWIAAACSFATFILGFAAGDEGTRSTVGVRAERVVSAPANPPLGEAGR